MGNLSFVVLCGCHLPWNTTMYVLDREECLRWSLLRKFGAVSLILQKVSNVINPEIDEHSCQKYLVSLFLSQNCM